MSDSLKKLTYQTFQQGKSYFAQFHKTIGNNLKNLIYPPGESKTNSIPLEALLKIRQQLDELIEIDWQDRERGIYPDYIIFDNLWEDFFRFYPVIWLDMLSVWQRTNDNNNQEFSSEIDTRGYPSYYLQNFHNQTDGYLSDMSANLYDLQVELLFSGTADLMRRRILAPLKLGLKKLFAPNNLDEIPCQQLRVLDIACGTARTLKFIRATLPKASLYGIDLSHAYLQKANQLLSEEPGVLPQLIQANAEELPFRDNYFQATTSVFVFHELPHPVRQRVIEEAFRVTQPGGIFVICDSIQAMDSPEFIPIMDNFPVVFHEPYYKHYITDDLVERLQTAGFVNISTEIHLFSKYWVARKPE